MQIIKRQERLGSILFSIAVGIHLLIMVVGYSEWNVPMQGRLMQLAFGLFCIKILLTYYTKQEWIALALLGSVGAISYISNGDEYVLSIVVMVFAAKSTDMKHICKWIFVTVLAFTVGIALLSLAGIGGIPVDVRDYGRGGVEARWCLGFGHANNFHGTIWYLTAIFIYLYFERLNWKHYLMLTAGNILLFILTASRGGLIAVQLVIIAAFLLKYVKKLNKCVWIYWCGIFSIIGVSALSLISASYDWQQSSVLIFLNRIFTGRIYLAYEYANISTWNLLLSAGEVMGIDNGFVVMFFVYGYVIGIAHIFLYIFLVYKSWQQKEGMLLVILVTAVFYTFMEATYMINTSYILSNISYIVWMIVMAGKKESGNESEQLEDKNS